MQQHLQAIVTVLSLVNPLICGAMFAQIGPKTVCSLAAKKRPCADRQPGVEDFE